jgi:hypothetical protein
VAADDEGDIGPEAAEAALGIQDALICRALPTVCPCPIFIGGREAENALEERDIHLRTPDLGFSAVGVAALLERERFIGLAAGDGSEHGVEGGAVFGVLLNDFIERLESAIDGGEDFGRDAFFGSRGEEAFFGEDARDVVGDGEGVIGADNVENLPGEFVVKAQGVLEVGGTSDFISEVGEEFTQGDGEGGERSHDFRIKGEGFDGITHEASPGEGGGGGSPAAVLNGGRNSFMN